MGKKTIIDIKMVNNFPEYAALIIDGTGLVSVKCNYKKDM